MTEKGETTSEAEYYENLPEVETEAGAAAAPSGESGPLGKVEDSVDSGAGIHGPTATTDEADASVECGSECEEGEVTNDEDEDYIITTTDQTTTEEKFGSDTTVAPFTTAQELPFLQRHGARFCVALAGVATGILTRISLCMNSYSSKSAMVVAKQQDNYYRQYVSLPFDPSTEAGKFTIRWLPDRIIWWANDQQIAEIKDGSTAIKIPDQPLHIKIFVAPFRPLIQGTGKLVKGTGKFWQHSMRVFKAAYRKIGNKNPDKTEL